MEEDEKRGEPTGPPPVTKGKSIPIKDAHEHAAAKAKEPEPKKEEPAEAKVEPEAIAMPLSQTEKDLQAIDMGDDIDSNREAAPTSQFAPKKPKRNVGKKLVKFLIVAGVIAVIGFAGWWLLKKVHKSKNEQPAKQATTQSQQSQAAPTIKTYTNDTIKVELSYLSSWKVTEKAKQVIFTSPEISYTKKDGSAAKGSFRLIVQQGYSQDDSSAINNAVAVKTSELLKYTAPVTGQRTETYQSFVGPDAQTFAFFLISSGKQYNPGDKVAGTLPLGQDSYVIVGGYGKGDGGNIDFDSIAPAKIEQNDVFTQATDIVKSLKITG